MRRLGMSLLLAPVLALLLPSAVAQAAGPSTFLITGSGFGHGVGMSQYGAYGMALDGNNATQILQHYYTGTTISPANDNVPLRVNLFASNTAQFRGEPAIPGAGGVDVAVDGVHTTGQAFQVFNLAVSGTKVAVTSNNAAVGTGDLVTVGWAFTLLNVPGPGQPFDDDPRAHRYLYGSLDVAVVGGQLQVVNQVRLHQDYLKGIAEVPSSWPAATLQAQVDAARTYALRKYAAGVRPDCRCHVTDDTRDQVFAGWSKEAEPTYGQNWVQAVAATSDDNNGTGQAILSAGALISANYFSSSGGRTENNEDGFGPGATPLPYLRSVDDHWSLDPRVKNPMASWTRTKSQGEMAFAFNLPDVTSYDISDRSAGGSVRSAVGTASNSATATISGASFRSRLNLPGGWVRKPVVRVAGADRYATSAAIGDLGVPSGDTVVIASGETAHLVDGLVAGPLAHAKAAPLLLATATGLPAPIITEIDRRKPSKAILVGGAGALGPGVKSDLQAHGVPASGITQLAGTDRYDTARVVAAAMGGTRPNVVIASGEPGHLVDALTAGGPAGAVGQPVLLVTLGAVPAPTKQALTELSTTKTAVVGGVSSVSDATMAQLPSPTRVAGNTRYTTALKVSDYFFANIPKDAVFIASGADANLSDALAGGALGRIMILTTPSPLQPDSEFWLRGNPEIGAFYVLGGTGAVADSTLAQIRTSVGG
ncbi:MAG: SpoIID/LytB protein [Acidimicrobiales bacterium]|jgi:stage II sporulation protein D|nr:SpoIID/LytB protein [Acidimicrobiales bacterium]